MSKVVRLTESEMVSFIKNIIKESFDSKKLYSRDYVVHRLKNGPRELREYIKKLPYIDCTDNQGNQHVCTTVPEVVYIYLSGKY